MATHKYVVTVRGDCSDMGGRYGQEMTLDDVEAHIDTVLELVANGPNPREAIEFLRVVAARAKDHENDMRDGLEFMREH